MTYAVLAFTVIALLFIALAAIFYWLQTVQLPRLIVERQLLGIKPGQCYWSWPSEKRLEKLLQERGLKLWRRA